MGTTIAAWNVNGIRATHTKGLVDYIMNEPTDIFCLQETKAKLEQLPEELVSPEG